MTSYLKPLLLSALAGTALSVSACSQASSADATPVAAAPEITGGNWDIQPEGSHLRFTADQEGEPFTGAFEAFTGVIRFDPAAPEDGAVEITVPLKSVDAGSNDRNSTLPEKVWFSAKAFPAAVYRSTDISATDSGYLARGMLTIKGISMPLDLPFKLDVEDNVAVMTSTVEMDRTRWNVGEAPWDTDEWISRKVKLDIQVTAEKKN